MASAKQGRHQPAFEYCAYLSSASKIIGDLFFESAARIDGQVEGDILAKDRLIVGDTARIEGRIQAPDVLVAGAVIGDIEAARRIEIRASARIAGNLTAPTLVVEPGAVLDGHCTMPAPQPHALDADREPQLIVLNEAVDMADQAEPSQHGISFFITKKQRADLRARGYDDDAIDKMKPGDAHRILGIN